MLRIYISDHCLSCSTAFQRAEQLQIERPDVPWDIVDVDDPEADVPAKVIGTPMYLWNDYVLFMGNPGESELLQRVGALHDDTR
jgi:hypothetical protein